MAQATPNSNNNINIPHGISAWFQKDYAGDFYDLGDLLVNEISLTPEFSELKSNRNGGYSTRKKVLTDRSASVTMTMREVSVTNLQRVLYGGTVALSQSLDVYDGREMTLAEDSTGLYVDMDDVEAAADISSITVIDAFETDDITEATSAVLMAPTADGVPDSNGLVYFTSIGSAVDGDTVYVRYKIAETGLASTEIFGSTDATIEGAAQVQARNQNGGVVQLWQLASVQLAPGGALSYPVDTEQSVDLEMTLQERSGTFGKLYAA